MLAAVTQGLFRGCRLWLLLGASWLLSLGSAGANVAGSWLVHGFSADGRYFLFEQFGEDDMGWPYQTLFLLDRQQDRYLADTPLRNRWTEDDPRLEQGLLGLRRAQQSQLAELQADWGIVDPGSVMIASDLAGFPKRLSFGADPDAGLPGARPGRQVSVTLRPRAIPAPADCAAWGPGVMLFDLELEQGADRRLLSSDSALPPSRGCPQDYALTAILRAQSGGFVALISVITPGFEGLDRQFIALPFALDAL